MNKYVKDLLGMDWDYTVQGTLKTGCVLEGHSLLLQRGSSNGIYRLVVQEDGTDNFIPLNASCELTQADLRQVYNGVLLAIKD